MIGDHGISGVILLWFGSSCVQQETVGSCITLNIDRMEVGFDPTTIHHIRNDGPSSRVALPHCFRPLFTTGIPT